MNLFMAITGALVIALILGLGMWALIYSVRMLRRGDEVTAEEAVKWRRSALKQGFYASPEMTPAITDILVRAWRSANGWIMLGLGVGALLGGMFGAAYFVYSIVTIGAGSASSQAFVIAIEGTLLTAILFGLVGLVVSLLHIKREPRNATQHPAVLGCLRGYRMRYVTVYMVAVVIGDFMLMMLLVVRLAPGFDGASPTSVLVRPYLWLAPVAPATLFIAAMTTRLVAQWAGALPSLELPQDQEVRQRADRYLRIWAVRRTYSFFQQTAYLVVFAQLILLNTNLPSRNTLLGFSPSPLNRTGLDFWLFGLFVLVTIGGIPLTLSLLPAVQTPGPLYEPWP